VSGFSAEWLTLREPADAAARSQAVTTFAVQGLQAGARLLDLGGGTGANIRYLSKYLHASQDWTIVDDDAELLVHAPAGATKRRADLNHVVDDDAMFRGCSLVTASALLDLVSERWLNQLIARCRLAGTAVLFALNYDGLTRCEPNEPEDDDVRRLVNEHQRGDKGFGVALGPTASARAVELLSASGYEVRQERSDWELRTTDTAALQRQLIAGWAQAASEMNPTDSAAFARWRDRRIVHVDAFTSRIVVGHVDVAGVCRA
jgi:hypothetical protein